uniref:AAA+ ATPase domain-containing protein n=1 Tax=Globisporangium ultimum (strain ATCC 200006 / CBS 805.95 / DAOM BR144) TaxID=431595 RepID=K3X2A4_GLOUD
MASTECPICSRHFRTENLALHVDACLQKSAMEEKRRARAQELAKPLFASPAAAKQLPSAPAATPQRRHSLPPSSDVEPNYASAPQNAQSKKRKRDQHQQPSKTASAPLAERMRPSSLDDLVGQDELLGPGKLLSSLIHADRVPNMILWGPPGCGKTTLAHVISKRTGCKFLVLSGASSNLADMKDAVEKARGERKMFRRHTIVFVDEIHRFKKNQQDFFLPAVEDGTITLIGATTENPSFEINNALLSRCRVYTLQKHTTESIQTILVRALQDPISSGLLQNADLPNSQEESNHGNGNGGDAGATESLIQADDAAVEYLAKQCGGDARVALNCLEMAVQTSTTRDEKNRLHLTEDHVKHCFAHRQTLFYDRNADFHYDLISAFHKSIRGSDANATLYWLARMLEGGENPLYIARRMIRIASEDVGLDAPELLPQAVAAYHAAHFVGMPECDVVLAQVATMLARAPKSVEIYKAYNLAKQSIRQWDECALPDVPLHLRNAPTKLMADLGYKKGYLYNPDHTPEELKDQTYLPTELLGTDFFSSGNDDDMKRNCTS